MAMFRSSVNIKLRYLTLLLAGIIIHTIDYAQDLRFTQYFNNPLTINPSLAGEESGNGRFFLNYRSQWNGITANPYKTFGLSFDRSVYRDNLFGGIQIIKDEAGDSYMGTTQIDLSIAPKVLISAKDYLKIGLMGTWANRYLNTSDLTWNNQFDGKSLNTSIYSGEDIYNKSSHYFDCSTGILWTHMYSKNSRLNTGLSAFHIMRPRYKLTSEFDKPYIRWVAHMDANLILIPSSLSLYPSALIMAQGPSRSYTAGLIAGYNLGPSSRYTGYYKSSKVFAGAFCRYKDAIILYTGFEYRDQLRINISYDINISKLIAVSGARGGMEISLAYTIPKKNIVKLK